MENFLLDFVLPLFLALLLALGNILIAYAVRWLAAKAKISIEKAWIEKAQGIVEEGVLAVEEKAAAAVKEGLSEWTADTKYLRVIDYVLGLVPDLSKEKADAMIHAVLARTPALGASGSMLDLIGEMEKKE